MAELLPRHIPSNEQNALKARREKEDRGKKRSAFESPKLNGKSKTRVKPRITPGQKAAEGLERNEEIENIENEEWRDAIPRKKKEKEEETEGEVSS